MLKAIPDMTKPVWNWTCLKCKHAIIKKVLFIPR